MRPFPLFWTGRAAARPRTAATPAGSRSPGCARARAHARAGWRPWRIAFALALGLAAVGCGPRVVEDPIVTNEDFRVSLRRTLEDGEPQPRGYSHPAVIADVRLAHILANLEFEDADGKRRPAIRSVHVYPLAEALNKAIVEAGPDDEVVAAAFSTDRRMGLFTTRRVTSFRLFFLDDRLRVEFFDLERSLERAQGRPGIDNDYSVPEAPPELPSFRLLPGDAHFADGRAALDIQWRDPYFARPVRLSVRGGRLKRRTVLMEDESPESTTLAVDELEELADDMPDEVRDAQISALDQLEGLRRQGLIKEAEFQRRRRLILQGKLDEAGYGPDSP